MVILKNQSYTIGTRTYTRANLKWVQDYIAKQTKLEFILAPTRNSGLSTVASLVKGNEAILTEVRGDHLHRGYDHDNY